MKPNQNTDKEEDERILKIASRIRALRLQKGYSSHEYFAWDNNLSRAQYFRIEKGSNITMKTLLSILDIHGISLGEFFGEM